MKYDYDMNGIELDGLIGGYSSSEVRIKLAEIRAKLDKVQTAIKQNPSCYPHTLTKEWAKYVIGVLAYLDNAESAWFDDDDALDAQLLKMNEWVLAFQRDCITLTPEQRANLAPIVKPKKKKDTLDKIKDILIPVGIILGVGIVGLVGYKIYRGISK